MKRLTIVTLVLFAFVMGAVGSAQAFTFAFDESGKGQYDLGTGTVPNWINAPGYMWPDWTVGGLYNNSSQGIPVLVYDLPQTTSTGDVRIWEERTTAGAPDVLSDVLRFTTGGRTVGPVMIFYSLLDSPRPAISADTGLPTLDTINDGGGLWEVKGVVTWLPDLYNSYYAYSDVPLPGVPLPSALFLLAPGLVGIFGLRRKLNK